VVTVPRQTHETIGRWGEQAGALHRETCGVGDAREKKEAEELDDDDDVHEEVEREAEREEPVGEGAHGRERAEVEREHQDVGAGALGHDARAHVLRRLGAPRRDHHAGAALRQHARRLRADPRRRARDDGRRRAQVRGHLLRRRPRPEPARARRTQQVPHRPQHPR